MKTWQIYTLIGLAACITLMQAWTTYRMVQSEAVFPMKAVQYLKKKEFDKQLNTLKTTTYYWRAIPKDQLTEEYVPVSYTHLRAHETRHDLVCRLLLEKKKTTTNNRKPTRNA